MKGQSFNNILRTLIKHVSNLIKASKLKPDAPEFVPLADSGFKSNFVHVSRAHKKSERKERKSAADLSKKNDKVAGKRVANAESMPLANREVLPIY